MAVDLNPNDSETLIAAACGLAFLGHIDDARNLSAQAVQLNPIYPEYYSDYLANIHFMGGDFQATITAVDKCSDGFPDRAVVAAAAWAHLGRRAGAAAAYRYFVTVTVAKWEGPRPADADRLEDRIMEVLPIHWPAGRQSLLDGLRLARWMAAEALAG